MGHVDSSQVSPLYANTTPGLTADANVFDPAIAALIVAINENFDSFEAFKASVELPIPDQSIVTRHLRNSAVTNPKLAPLAVTADKIADGTITTAKLADLVITAAKIANGTITEPKYETGSVSSRALALGSVTYDKLDPSLIAPISDSGINAKFAELDARNAVNISAYDFGIVADTGISISSVLIQNFFDYCETHNGVAIFDKGVYKISGDNLTLPSHGIEGKGRNTTTLEFYPTNPSNYCLKIGVEGNFTKIKGNISNVRITVPNDSASNILYITTPSRAFNLENVSFMVGSGFCVSLDQCYYIHFKDVVFEGPFRTGLATNTATLYTGTALRNVGTSTSVVNNITFTKPDFRYLSQIWSSPTGAFNGSNTISFYGGAFESIGDLLFNTRGFRISFYTVYFENLDRNQNVSGRPNQSDIILSDTGAGEIVYDNCLVNLVGVRSSSKMLRHIVGSVRFRVGSITSKPITDYVVIDPVTYSSRGIVINDGCEGLPQNIPAIERRNQLTTLIYPNAYGQELFSNFITESKYANNTLHHQSMASPQAFTFSTVQPIVSIAGTSDTSSHFVEIEVTLLRFIPATSTVGWKSLILRFLINPDMPATITPDIQTVVSGGDQAGFSDANILTKIVAARRTAARTDMLNPYTWHYQIYINGETGGATGRILANRVKTNIIWIAAGARDTAHPNYDIYPQSHTFGANI